MNVLKKFGSLLGFCLIISIVSLGQQTENCDKTTKIDQVKKDPIDFIHNYLLKPSASNPAFAKHNNPETPAIKKASKASQKTIAESKKVAKETILKPTVVTATQNKKVVSATEVYTESEFKALQQSNTEKKAKPTTMVATNCDVAEPLSNRLVTKTLSAKKEESNFGTSMMEWVKDKYSAMIEVLPNQISNVMLYRFIDEWYGVKYRMGGTSKKGVDCSAFVQTLYKYVFGMDLLRTAFLQFNSSAKIIKNPAELKEGDLVFFRVNSSRISHVGVYLRNNFFVHSASSKGVSIAKLTNAYWSKYFAGGGRIME